MNSLLKRQIRKYLPEKFKSDEDLNEFLEAIEMSYNTSDEQFKMLQRAASISSEELFESNQQLRQESEAQKNIITKLNNVINTLKFYGLDESKNLEETDSLKLVDFIDNQTKEIIEINKQKDILLANLEKQNLELNDYAHMITHDLQSPLQSIEALTTWLKGDYEDKIDDGGKEIIRLIGENVEKMDSLIKNIYEYTTIDKIYNKKREIDLNILIKELLPSIKNPKNIRIKIQDNLPTISADNYRLNLLFYHLIDNAIKYNDKGDKGLVEILCEDNLNYWKFCIRDNGKGIENQYLYKIFNAFQKLNNDNQSSGIGLSIVKKIVEVYYGNITIKSNPGVETLVIFTLKK
ncbi:sensor histidine kinase [Polaribacter dokdonensis]|uniref:histidine kinase n=1 Tax=Polaribacter dokdonensis DSW-5 TaxID=1300348 RepID=A0A0N1IY91_9FLAO|nr:ATP-binding protein [Polaribacter dokdonensis]KOY52694.1 Two-component system sensor histidine kinase [Polaribacter dokdonensis DSW-5]SEE50609.1 Histidine kinase-, DNA gyrase B-, and HSP90-like ATPase [Polaribacter dokdonensis DSW-5]